MKRIPKRLVYFGKGANEEVARAKLEEGLEIKLRTVEELLKEI
jgi:hypothetical protein